VKTSARLRTIGLLAAAFVIAAPLGIAHADKVMRVGMTASDIPTTGGIPNNGGEGFRFLGYPAYDALINWDFTHTDKTADVTPGLATSWEVDEVDRTRWVFHLRKGVKFHDGTDWNADVAIWNLDRYFKQDAPQFDPPNAAVAVARDPYVAGYRKIDDWTIEIANPRPISYFPNMATWILHVSPTQFAKTGSWAEFAKAPAGSGPFKITEFK